MSRVCSPRCIFNKTPSPWLGLASPQRSPCCSSTPPPCSFALLGSFSLSSFFPSVSSVASSSFSSFLFLSFQVSSVASSSRVSVGSPLPRFGRFSFCGCFSLSLSCVLGGLVSFVAYIAQLGRVGGSRWGWVLQIK